MNIGTVVVVLILIALFLGGVIWMEIHSRKTGPKERRNDPKNSAPSEMEIAALYSPFPTLRRDEATLSKARTKERKL
jgi:hypothetical protein